MSSSNLPWYEESFSEVQAVDFISTSILVLQTSKNSSNYLILKNIFETLSNSYFELQRHQHAMCNELVKRNYVPIVAEYLDRFKKIGYFNDDNVWNCTKYALHGLWTFSDGSKHIGDEILKTQLPKLLISNVLEYGRCDIEDSDNEYLVTSSINIIHNVVRMPGNEGPFKITEFKQILVELIRKNHSDFMNIISMITLAILVNENELNLLEDGENTIKTLISDIQKGFENEDRRINGFAIWELINGLRCVSANDNMKKLIAEEGGIDVLIKILKKSNSDDEVEKSLGVIWNLCFDQEIRSILVNNFDLKNVIRPYEDHGILKIKKSCEGISWLIENIARSNERMKSACSSRSRALKDKWKFDVFLSYSWANKPMVLSIRKELAKSNINVWIDVDQMKGSTLEAMADGIENSQLFVMAVSDTYRTSANCRTEAEYAFQLKKPIIPLIMELKYKPTSWLGLIIGSKMYYEFSERRDFMESFNGLLENIKAIQASEEY